MEYEVSVSLAPHYADVPIHSSFYIQESVQIEHRERKLLHRLFLQKPYRQFPFLLCRQPASNQQVSQLNLPTSVRLRFPLQLVGERFRHSGVESGAVFHAEK